ncbi:hypothetical protein B8W96_06795 [Lentilactobacillus parakefiri]|nr:hypothetical protein B8W96_06795 [Lentilactobacillus parakefiri]
MAQSAVSFQSISGLSQISRAWIFGQARLYGRKLLIEPPFNLVGQTAKEPGQGIAFVLALLHEANYVFVCECLSHVMILTRTWLKGVPGPIQVSHTEEHVCYALLCSLQLLKYVPPHPLLVTLFS